MASRTRLVIVLVIGVLSIWSFMLHTNYDHHFFFKRYEDYKLGELPLQTSYPCFVLLRYPFRNTLVSRNLKTLEKNRKHALSMGCFVKTVFVQEKSCSHWSKGVKHHSHCLIQDILSFAISIAERGRVDTSGRERLWIITVTEKDVLSEASWTRLIELTTSSSPINQTSQLVVINSTEIVLFKVKPDLKTVSLVPCRIWKSSWASLMQSRGDDLETTLQDVLLTMKKEALPYLHTMANKKTIQKLSFCQAFPSSCKKKQSIVAKRTRSSEHAELASYRQYLYKLFSRSAGPAGAAKTGLSKVSTFENALRTEFGDVIIRLHYSRDKCTQKGVLSTFEYPEFVFPKLDCEPPPDETISLVPASKTRARVAILYFYTILGRTAKHKHTASYAERYLPQVVQLTEQLNQRRSSPYTYEVVLATSSLENYEPFRQDFVSRWKNEFLDKEHFKHIVVDSFTEADFDPELLEMIKSHWNCCGWSEYQKLGVWKLEEYKSIVLLDFDASFNSMEAIERLFLCSEKGYQFLSTTDPKAALQGGFYFLKPSLAIFNQFKNVLSSRKVYQPFSGWNNTGPMFTMLLPEEKLREKRHDTQSFASETPQGFLFYFFYVFLPEQGLNLGPVGQLEVCDYNYRAGYMTYFSSGMMDFVCHKSYSHAKKQQKITIPVKVFHGSQPRIDQISLSSFLFDRVKVS